MNDSHTCTNRETRCEEGTLIGFEHLVTPFTNEWRRVLAALSNIYVGFFVGAVDVDYEKEMEMWNGEKGYVGERVVGVWVYK